MAENLLLEFSAVDRVDPTKSSTHFLDNGSRITTVSSGSEIVHGSESSVVSTAVPLESAPALNEHGITQSEADANVVAGVDSQHSAVYQTLTNSDSNVSTVVMETTEITMEELQQQGGQSISVMAGADGTLLYQTTTGEFVSAAAFGDGSMPGAVQLVSYADGIDVIEQQEISQQSQAGIQQPQYVASPRVGQKRTKAMVLAAAAALNDDNCDGDVGGCTHIHPQLKAGGLFDSYEELMGALAAYSEATDTTLSRRTSVKLSKPNIPLDKFPFERLVFQCNQTGRRRGGVIIKCPVVVNISYNFKQGAYMIRKGTFEHNHRMSASSANTAGSGDNSLTINKKEAVQYASRDLSKLLRKRVENMVERLSEVPPEKFSYYYDGFIRLKESLDAEIEALGTDGDGDKGPTGPSASVVEDFEYLDSLQEANSSGFLSARGRGAVCGRRGRGGGFGRGGSISNPTVRAVTLDRQPIVSDYERKSIAKGSSFATFADVVAAIEAFGRRSATRFITRTAIRTPTTSDIDRDAFPYFRAAFACVYQGPPKKLAPSKTKAEDGGMNPCWCPVQVSVSFKPNLGAYMISKSMLQHNHVVLDESLMASPLDKTALGDLLEVVPTSRAGSGEVIVQLAQPSSVPLQQGSSSQVVLASLSSGDQQMLTPQVSILGEVSAGAVAAFPQVVSTEALIGELSTESPLVTLAHIMTASEIPKIDQPTASRGEAMDVQIPSTEETHLLDAPTSASIAPASIADQAAVEVSPTNKTKAAAVETASGDILTSRGSGPSSSTLTPRPPVPVAASRAAPLTVQHRAMLLSSAYWLTDGDVNAFSALLTKQTRFELGEFVGLEDVIALGQAVVAGNCGSESSVETSNSRRPSAKKHIQILSIEGNHWVCVSTSGCVTGEVDVYDSLQRGASVSRFRALISSMIRRPGSFRLNWVSLPPGGSATGGTSTSRAESECGVYACAYAQSLLNGQDPAKLTYRQADMRRHLVECLESGEARPFPSKVKFIRADQRVSARETVKTHCVCNLSADVLESMYGVVVNECARCKNTFHSCCEQMDGDSSFVCSRCGGKRTRNN